MLFDSLVEQAWRLHHGMKLKRNCEGGVVSPTALLALQVRRVWIMPVRVGRGALMIWLTGFTKSCKIFRQEVVRPPYHTVMKPVMIFSILPWCKIRGGTHALISLRRT